MKQECERFSLVSVVSFSIRHFEARITPLQEQRERDSKRGFSCELSERQFKEESNKDVSPRTLIFNRWVNEEAKKYFFGAFLRVYKKQTWSWYVVLINPLYVTVDSAQMLV